MNNWEAEEELSPVCMSYGTKYSHTGGSRTVSDSFNAGCSTTVAIPSVAYVLYYLTESIQYSNASSQYYCLNSSTKVSEIIAKTEIL